MQEGWENKDYLASHTSGFDAGEVLFSNFDARAAVKTCELDFDKVREVTRLYATRKSSLRYDLGIFMGRHSGLNSYLIVILQSICGRLCVPGGNVINGHMMPIGPNSDERDPKIMANRDHQCFPGLRLFPAQCHAGRNSLRSSRETAGGIRHRFESPALVCGHNRL
ncbi:MAG: hypothetical protein MZV70_49695 [Desulfobacterales bacterium]|nr:hypothetical protein [Desulfobacterales bacterium]